MVFELASLSSSGFSMVSFDLAGDSQSQIKEDIDTVRYDIWSIRLLSLIYT